MAEITYFVALPFVARRRRGGWRADRMLQSRCRVMRAQALSRNEGHVGAVAFSRTGDPATGNFSAAKVIGRSATCRMI